MSVTDDDINVLINEELLARRTKAMYLKNAGATLSQIAKENGVSIATVRKDLEIVRRDINNEQPMDVIARHRQATRSLRRHDPDQVRWVGARHLSAPLRGSPSVEIP